MWWSALFWAAGALITADASDALADEARRRGYALLRKPVRPAALRGLLAALAAGGGGGRAAD